jgi:hypothetical protein
MSMKNQLTPAGTEPATFRFVAQHLNLSVLPRSPTYIGTEYFINGIYSPFLFPLQNAVCFIFITYLVHVLLTFYIQGVLKLKKIIIPAPKG